MVGDTHATTLTELRCASWFPSECHPPLLCSLIREIRSLDCFGRFFLPNEYSGENTDGWTVRSESSSLFLRKRQPLAGGVGILTSKPKHTMHNAPVKFRLFRNAGSSSLMRPGGLPIYRNNTRGTSCIFRSSRQ